VYLKEKSSNKKLNDEKISFLLNTINPPYAELIIIAIVQLRIGYINEKV